MIFLQLVEILEESRQKLILINQRIGEDYGSLWFRYQYNRVRLVISLEGIALWLARSCRTSPFDNNNRCTCLPTLFKVQLLCTVELCWTTTINCSALRSKDGSNRAITRYHCRTVVSTEYGNWSHIDCSRSQPAHPRRTPGTLPGSGSRRLIYRTRSMDRQGYCSCTLSIDRPTLHCIISYHISKFTCFTLSPFGDLRPTWPQSV